MEQIRGDLSKTTKALDVEQTSFFQYRERSEVTKQDLRRKLLTMEGKWKQAKEAKVEVEQDCETAR